MHFRIRFFIYCIFEKSNKQATTKKSNLQIFLLIFFRWLWHYAIGNFLLQNETRSMRHLTLSGNPYAWDGKNHWYTYGHDISNIWCAGKWSLASPCFCFALWNPTGWKVNSFSTPVNKQLLHHHLCVLIYTCAAYGWRWPHIRAKLITDCH